jgi:hypothetical protein
VRTDPLPEIIERRERITRRENSPEEQQEAERTFAIFAPADIHWLIAEVERLRALVGPHASRPPSLAGWGPRSVPEGGGGRVQPPQGRNPTDRWGRYR